MTALSIGIVGDFDAGFAPHPATDLAIEHAQSVIGGEVSSRWVPTSAVAREGLSCVAGLSGLWIAPGSPYRSMEGALMAIQYARVTGVPLLATCGGFQHVVLEYARNALGFTDAAHAEYDPYASRLFVTPLSCSLVGRTMTVHLTDRSLARAQYGHDVVSEQYYCNFGLNPAYERELATAGLRVVGRDADGEARILELGSHPFFVATLFVPQLTSTAARPHPLICGFLATARRFANRSLEGVRSA